MRGTQAVMTLKVKKLGVHSVPQAVSRTKHCWCRSLWRTPKSNRPVTGPVSSPVTDTYAFCFVLVLKKLNEAGIKSSM
ncbi:rCG63220 [Rattus norvegicus]|uniref:RCG63220 n=1 Tax=Rattus norvegicus TaxID=10116 RepID=A6IY68_RAT|nr:rCG63220 [Rattus norvegicus]